MSEKPVNPRFRRYKIIVTSASNAQREVHPLSFTWRSVTYVIASWGRRWQAVDGEHFLVMTAEGRMFELVYHPQDGGWFLLRSTPTPSRV